MMTTTSKVTTISDHPNETSKHQQHQQQQVHVVQNSCTTGSILLTKKSVLIYVFGTLSISLPITIVLILQQQQHSGLQ